MDTLMIEKGAGKWCLHTAEGDHHLAQVSYRGQGKWFCLCPRDASTKEGLEEQTEWALDATSVDEAQAAAVVKCTENGLIPRLEEIRKDLGGKLPHADDIEDILFSDGEKEMYGPDTVLRSLLLHTLNMHFQHAVQIGEPGVFVSSVIEVLAAVVTDSVREDKFEDAKQRVLKAITDKIDENVANKRKHEETQQKLMEEIKGSLGELFGLGKRKSPPTH